MFHHNKSRRDRILKVCEPKLTPKGTDPSSFHKDPVKNFLVIDEISFVSRDMFYMIDTLLQELFQSKEFCGGINIILGGDFFQLDPINGLPLWDSYEDFRKLHIYHLNSSERNEPVLADLVKKVREGNFEAIKPHLLPMSRFENLEDRNFTVFSTRENIERFSRKSFDQDQGKPLESHVGQMFVFCDSFEEKREDSQVARKGSYPAREGDLAILNTIKETEAVFTFLGNGFTISVPRNLISVTKDGPCVVRRIYATTIHKIQGSTIKSLDVVFEPIFIYSLLSVGISRTKSLDNLRVFSDNLSFSKEVELSQRIKIRKIQDMFNRMTSLVKTTRSVKTS